jgi:hypothetical protein
VSKIELWQSTVMVCAGAVQTLALLPLKELIEAGDHSLAIGPITDPTLWRDKAVPLQQDLELLKAARTFVTTMQRAVAEAERRGELKKAG